MNRSVFLSVGFDGGLVIEVGVVNGGQLGFKESDGVIYESGAEL